ncbi:hypothetical protein [Ruminococcus sp.]|uniref:hypothetical protein n=1 Tax=Ruminococcus sp. TaxID=41978 RepID=UPI0025CE9885|nr:hypothetical protein [Ruminococcus sp.]MBR1430144.1 hypothetical protein [Ruminococcus sp.]
MGLKYTRIYDAIHSVKPSSVTDWSGWNSPPPNCRDPLWICAEYDSLGIRLWAVDNGKLRVTTANMKLSSDSRKYHESQFTYGCRNQAEAASYIRRILHPETEAKAT